MSRENFIVKLSSIEEGAAPIGVVIHNISGIAEVPAEGKTAAHTLVATVDGKSYKVRESYADVLKKAASRGVLMEV